MGYLNSSFGLRQVSQCECSRNFSNPSVIFFLFFYINIFCSSSVNFLLTLYELIQNFILLIFYASNLRIRFESNRYLSIQTISENHFSVRRKTSFHRRSQDWIYLDELNFLKIIRRKKREVWNVQRLEDPWKWTVGVHVMENGVKGKLCFPFVRRVYSRAFNLCRC